MKQKMAQSEIDIKEALWIIIRVILIIGFIFLAICGSYNHERWADEAQAWLLARDNSALELIFSFASYEGSPVLWHLILKLAISMRTYLFIFWSGSDYCNYHWACYF